MEKLFFTLCRILSNHLVMVPEIEPAPEELNVQ